MYVGITKNIISRWKRHKWDSKSKIESRKHAIHYALSKYGFDNFIFKIIETLPNLEIANQREIEWIKFLKQERYQLYNETDGGDGALGHPWTDEQKQKASERNSDEGNPMYGIQLLGEANGNFGKEMKPHVKDILIKIRRKLSDEQIQEIISLYSSEKHSQTSLSKQFNVSLTQIHRIVSGKSWGNKKHDEVTTKKNLTINDIINIKQAYSSGKYTQKELSIQFNCSLTHMNRIINGKKWKNI
jgi:group I intron endonuclease